MALVVHRKSLSDTVWCLVYLVLGTVLLAKLFYFPGPYSPHRSIDWLDRDFQTRRTHTNRNIEFIYHHNGIAYDYHSENDLQRLYSGDQWRLWPLPSNAHNLDISPFVQSKLLFVDVIYIITNPRLTDRHRHLQKVFHRQGMSMESVQWRMKWNHTSCNAQAAHAFVYQRLNLKDKSLDREQQRRCAVTMEHVDVWYEIAQRKIRLALIVEDDVLFVPLFKEKLTRMISTAIRGGELRINGTCGEVNNQIMSSDERIHQDSMIVIGSCFHFHGREFRKHLSDAPPLLSTQKSNPSRCTHAYLLTSCSSQALVEQIHKQKNDFWPSDFLENHLFPLSPTLQSFWMDPPLAYQGNQIIDLDQIETFKTQTYK